MRAFSERNLIAQEMKRMSLIERILTSSNVHLNLVFPRNIYFRAKVLCEDVYVKTEEKFYLEHLIEMLFLDFLNEAIESQNVKETYKTILDYDRGTPNVRLLHYQTRNVEEVPIYPIRKKIDDEIEEFYCKLKRKVVLRGEVLLHDIAQVYPNHPFTLERVLEILLIDFISKYRKGEAETTIRSFIYEESGIS